MENVFALQRDDEKLMPDSYSNKRMLYEGILLEFPNDKHKKKLKFKISITSKLYDKYGGRLFSYGNLLDVCNTFEKEGEPITFSVYYSFERKGKIHYHFVKATQLNIVSKISNL